MKRLSISFVLMFSFACGSSSSNSESTTADKSATSAPAKVAAKPHVIAGQIDRKQLSTIVDAGLGRMLQFVKLAPVMEGKTFLGFRIEEMPQHASTTLGLRQGDIIMRVNGSPISKPTEAFQVWNSLRVVSEVNIEYLREASKHEARIAIVDGVNAKE